MKPSDNQFSQNVKQKNFYLETFDGDPEDPNTKKNKRLVTINKWSTTEQMQYLPTFGMLFAPIIEKFANILFSAGGVNQAPQNFDEDSALVSNILSQNSVFMFFQFLSADGNIEQIFNNILLKNVSVGGKQATMNTFDDIEDLLIVITEVLKYNYGKLLEGKGFTGFLQVSSAISKFHQS